MPNKCVRCNKTFEAGAAELRHGCACGSKAFVYFASAREARDAGDIRWVEKELTSIAGDVTPSVENVKIVEKGVFEVNVGALMRKPLIIKGEDGVYHVKLPPPKKKK